MYEFEKKIVQIILKSNICAIARVIGQIKFHLKQVHLWTHSTIENLNIWAWTISRASSLRALKGPITKLVPSTNSCRLVTERSSLYIALTKKKGF